MNAEGSESRKPRAKGQRAIAAALEDAHSESAVFLISYAASLIYPLSASASSFPRLGLCLSFLACFLFSARFTGGGVPSTARDAAFTALVALNFLSFFFFATIAIKSRRAGFALSLELSRHILFQVLETAASRCLKTSYLLSSPFSIYKIQPHPLRILVFCPAQGCKKSALKVSS